MIKVVWILLGSFILWIHYMFQPENNLPKDPVLEEIRAEYVRLCIKKTDPEYPYYTCDDLRDYIERMENNETLR